MVFACEDSGMKSSKELPRKERERLRHRQEILAAAMRLFAEKGFHDVSMQEIAAKAEFATGTLYKFFTSKEALFDELTHNCGQRIVGDLTVILDGPGDEVDRLRTFIRRQRAIGLTSWPTRPWNAFGAPHSPCQHLRISPGNSIAASAFNRAPTGGLSAGKAYGKGTGSQSTVT